MTKTYPLYNRIVSFIMALLMIFTSFIYMEMPSAEAAANLAFDQNNWKGWYECFLNDRSSMDAAGNLTVPTYNSVTNLYLHEVGYNPLSVSNGKLLSSLKQGNPGWDDFVAVSSNNYTYPAGYSITVDIQTGKDVTGVTVDSISDGSGFGAFSIAILQSSSLSTTPFTNWLWGTQFGLCGSEGYVVTFTAAANSKSYYDYYTVFYTDASGNISNPNSTTLTEKAALTSKIAMADGTSAVTLKLVRTAEDTYSIVLSNAGGTTQTLATGLNIDDEDQIYYGVGAFSAGLTETSSGAKPVTSSAFEISSVSDCSGVYSPSGFTGGTHAYEWITTDNYKYQVCSCCGAIGNKRYEIYYEANGGTGAPDDAYMDVDCNDNPEANVTFNVSSTLPTRSGYTFAGWLATSNDSQVNGQIYQAGASVKTRYHITLTAQWTEASYTLTLNTNGGTIEYGYSTTYSLKTNEKLSDVIGGFPTAARTGYTFNGWKLLASGEHWTDSWGTQPFTWGQDTTIVAQWIANQYTVDFDVNGDTQITFTGEPITVTFGSAYGTLPSISRVGYTFNGWYTAASGGTQVTSATVVSTASDHTLYAHWTANSYTLTFALDGGTMASGYSTTYTFKQDQLFADVIGGYPAPLKRGYIFDGWKNLSSGEHWTGGWGTQPYTYGANATLTAQWVEDPDFKPYYLIFDVNGGNLTSDHTTTYSIDTGDTYASIIGTIPTVERTGYTFGGWYNEEYDYTLNINDTFSISEDATFVAQWTAISSTVTLDLNDSTGTKASCGASSITVSYDSTYSALPTPTRTGYTFNGWYTAASGGTQIKTTDTVKITVDTTYYAQWSANSYTLTFDLNGGTMASGYSTVYTFKQDQLFVDVIGGYPVPTKTGYTFDGWQRQNYASDHWRDGWGTQPYTYGMNVTLVAQWVANSYTVTLDKNASDATLSTTSVTVTYGKAYGTLPEPSRGEAYIFDGWYTEAEGGSEVTSTTICTTADDHTLYAHWLNAETYTVTFIANGDLHVQDYRVAKTVAISGATLPDGTTSGTFEISKNQSFADVVGSDAYFPTHSSWTFIGWGGAYYDADGNVKTLILNSSNWNTAVFDGSSDVTFTAYYVCQHSKFANAISVWDSTTDPDRVIGRCRVCGYDGAYGYRMNFLARYNNEADILLSYGVPQKDLFTYENCLYDSTNGIIIDFLDITDTHPSITLKFNPVILAAQNRDAGWLGWTIDGKSIEAKKDLQFFFDQSNSEWNHHLTFRSAYEDGYHEIVFNAGSSLVGTDMPNGVLVDTNRRYGVMAIRNTDTYQSLLDYIPQAKHVAAYPEILKVCNPILGDDSQWHYFANDSYTLYCSIGWTNGDNFAGNDSPSRTLSMATAWNNGEIINSTTWDDIIHPDTKDIQMLPWYFSQPKTGADGAEDDGVAQGYLSTFYANNKAASADYNKAYYNPNERSGGTMYYMYKQSGTSYTCTPVFGFDRTNYGSDVFIFEPTTHEQMIADFNINEYAKIGLFDTYTTIIAKEPKRYTYYLGEGDHYVFPLVVSDPAGVSYEAYEETGVLDYNSGTDISDPGLDKVTDANGNVYYNSLQSSSNNFKISRSESGAPIYNIYTVHATWEGFGYPEGLPLGYPGLSYYFGESDALYTPVQPYGSAKTYFVTAEGYQDYGLTYGAGIPLTYPDGNGFVSMYPTLAGQGLPMQASYYQQWDFSVTFNANYPTGQKHDSTVGYPTSLPVNSDGTARTANIDKKGNHYVYSFFDSFGGTEGLNNKMFTCEDYVIDGWQLYNQNGDPVIYDHDNNPYTEGVYLIIDTSDKYPTKDVLKQLNMSRDEESLYLNAYRVSILNAYIYARAPGCEFRAIWKRVYDFTLIENGTDWGAENFARVKYTNRFEEVINPYFTETTTVKVYPETEITISKIAAASGYTYAYLAHNVQTKPTVPSRILTNAKTYRFVIISDTTMTAKFVSTASPGMALVDRSNQLLTAWAQRLYPSASAHRDGYNSFYSTTLHPSYALYRSGTDTYNVTVSGSTFSEANTSYTKHYDELITLMTGAKDFKGWKVNGVFISFDPIFEYRVTAEATVEAVYSGTRMESVSIVKSVTSDSRESVISTHAAPEGYKLIETGFLVSASEVAFTLDDVANNDYTKIVSANRLTDGTFKLFLPEGTNYVAAYAYYYDKNGSIVKCISSTITV